MNKVPLGRLLLIIIPIALVGIFGRVFYTPDEPREGSMVVSMAHQADHALPQLGGKPFAEKPPLLYWLGGAAVASFGPSPLAARAPNVLYLFVAVLAIAALATQAVGPAAGYTAGLVTATALQLYQVSVWLATDAPLLAGVALALLGAYRGLTARDSATCLRGYAVFHLGLLVAFFAKGPAGWMVPVCALATVVVFERRWQEFTRIEFWAGALLWLVPIALWVGWVYVSPSGPEALRILFWYNLVGRLVSIAAPQALDFATGHHNTPFKYLLELPLYLLPWTLLAIAGLRRAWRAARAQGPEGTAWRLALGAIVPATVLLSVAATARGVYYGPPALGFALATGLYVGHARTALDRWERYAWRGTGLCIGLLALILGVAIALITLAPALHDPVMTGLGVIGMAACALALYLCATLPVAADASLPRLSLALALVLTLGLGALLRPLNQWQSLAVVAERITHAVGDARLMLLEPDETTVAMVELYLPARDAPQPLGTQSVIAQGVDVTAAHVGAAHMLSVLTSDPETRVLWLVPKTPHWTWQSWLGFLGYVPVAPSVSLIDSAAAQLPPSLAPLRVECVLQRPGGRSYAILASPQARLSTGGSCE